MDLRFGIDLKSRNYTNNTEEHFPNANRFLRMRSFLAKSFRQRAFLENQKYGIRSGFPGNRRVFDIVNDKGGSRTALTLVL
jgi:hypothetical protein